MKKLKVTIIAPCLDEIEGIKWCLPRIKKEWYDEFIAVDGGSTDGTLEYLKENNYFVFRQSGVDLHNAYDEAYHRSTGDIIVTITPDGNSIPELIPALVEKIYEGYDMVIASRYLPPAKSDDDDILTANGNKVFTMIINTLFGGHYTDTTVGLRAYQRDAIEKMCLYDQDKQNWFRRKFLRVNSWELGASIRAAKLKLRVADIPGDEPKRIGGQRKMSIIRNGFGGVSQMIHEFIMGKKKFFKKM